MPSVYFPSEGGEVYGGAGGMVRGWLSVTQTDFETYTRITARTTGEWQKSYSRWLKIELYINWGLVGEAKAKILTTPSDWQMIVDTGSKSFDITRTPSVQTVPVTAILSIGNNSGNEVYEASRQTTIEVSVPAAYQVPAAPSKPVNERVSDTENKASWTRNATAPAPYTSQEVLRSTNGGAMAVVATVAATSTSYTDSTTQPDCSYAYAVRAKNPAGSSMSQTSDTTYNTPAACSGLSGARATGGVIELKWVNPARHSLGVDIQRSMNSGQTWVLAASLTGAGLTSASDVPGIGQVRYRVRNKRGTLVSAWSAETDDIVTISKPSPPTLTYPASSAAVSMAESLRLRWIHNSVDGSAQTAAKVRWSTNKGASWTEIPINSSSQYLDQPFIWPVNTEVTWQASTKGVHAEYSDWSVSRTFTLRQVPYAGITSPSSIITEMPMRIAFDYTDVSGSLLASSVSLLSAAGLVLWQTSLGAGVASYTLSAGDFLPTNQTDYSLQVTVTSTSSLSSASTKVLHIGYIEPAEAEAAISVDTDYGSVTVTVFVGPDDGIRPGTVSMSVYRNGVLLGSSLSNGATVIDRYPPLDVEVTYTVAAFAQSGLASHHVRTLTIPSSQYAFINFGDGYKDVLRLGLVPADTTWSTEHNVRAVEVWGNRNPIVRLGAGERKTGSIPGSLWRHGKDWPEGTVNATMQDAMALDSWPYPVIVRKPGGEVIPALKKMSLREGGEGLLAGATVSYEKVSVDGLYL
jgi:hypothetical protein